MPVVKKYLGRGRKWLLQHVNRAGSFRVNAERLMGPVVTEERPKGNVLAKQSVFSRHVCIISDTSGHGESLFLVCIHTAGRPRQLPPKLLDTSLIFNWARRLKCKNDTIENVAWFKMMSYIKYKDLHALPMPLMEQHKHWWEYDTTNISDKKNKCQAGFVLGISKILF